MFNVFINNQLFWKLYLLLRNQKLFLKNHALLLLSRISR